MTAREHMSHVSNHLPTCHTARLRAACAGVTLVEAAVCIVVVGVMLVAALQTVGASTRARAVQASQSQGPGLAAALLAEIRQARYDEAATVAPPVNSGETSSGESTSAPPVVSLFGPDAGEFNGKDRSGFDDVDDYHGWSESPPLARDGTPLPGTDGWRRDVTVEWVWRDQPQAPAFTDEGLKRITVTVTGPGGQRSSLSALRSVYGVYEQLPRTRTTYVSGVGVALQAGVMGTPIHSAANLANQVTTP